MRSSVVSLLAVAALAATAFGQTHEKTIWLPDSNVGLDEPTVVFHNPFTNRVYFAGLGTEYIHVYDANTGTKARRIDTLAYCPALAHCYNEHEVWALTDEGYIIVIDDRADSLVALLDVGWTADIAYNATMGKAYVLDVDYDQVLVYDVATRTRIDSIQLHDWPDFIVWDSVYNRVYVLGWDWEYYPIVAIDCHQDSIAEVMRGPWLGDDLLVHQTRRKLYCLGGEDSLHRAQLWVYNTEDLSVDTVVTLAAAWWDPGCLTLNPADDMLYAGYWELLGRERHGRRRGFWPEDTVAVFDCRADTLVGFVWLGDDFGPSVYCVNENDNKVYIGSFYSDSVAVLGAPDSITDWLKFRWGITALGWNPSNNQVYVGNEFGYVWVLDGRTDTVIKEVDYEGRYDFSMTWSPGLERLYLVNWEGVGWVGRGDSLENWYWFDNWWRTEMLAFSRGLNRFYLRDDDDRLRVYDCTVDSVVRTAQPPPSGCRRGIALDHLGKLYLPTHGGECVVYDTERDSVLRTVPGFGSLLMYQPANGLVYGWGYGPLLAVFDPSGDTLVASSDSWHVRDLTVNETDNEVYFTPVASLTEVYVMDGESHEVGCFTSLSSRVSGLVWVDSLDFLACICEHRTYIVDCRSRQLVRSYSRDDYGGWGLDRTNAILYDHTPLGHVTAMHCGIDSTVVFDVAAHHFCWDEARGGMFGSFHSAIHVFSYDPVGMQSQEKSKVRPSERSPTIVRGVLRLRAGADAVLLDAAGRRVMDLAGAPASGASGAVRHHDIRHVAPGVYFVCQPTADSRGLAAVRKVVIQR